ncbi:monovalent cation/H(+) antiporter subunit G [Oscillochloris sp. ZM17-4]|uniref:monovalent cation/H(+) antiporter subunit G n=1 Tax=Oscillochloris sp. ZM17-4 TaxID=2866714 RepID=UPI001C73B93D|nr:monovalent cation/H(+) antiporter subunit G [Oscillochloris sp. ZM17-4]MBX0327476.1 monovalent cation/H(+) antiporter subunit G [Oscillochloris sp. ZM17-4]
MTLIEILAVALTAVGVLFTLISSVGIIRMPDLYTRVHAVGKAGTLGVAGVLLGVAVSFADLLTGVKMLALVAFFFLTAPVATHMLDRAAFITGVRPIPATRPNDLEGAYDRESKRLR